MEEIVHNRITMDGMREIKVISDQPVTERRMLGLVPGAARGWERVHCYDTSALRLFYGEVIYPAREVVTVHLEGMRKPRRFAVWRLVAEEGLRVSEVIEHLAEWFFVQTHHRAGFVFMKALPSGAVSGSMLQVSGCDMALLEAEWALEKCVLVGG